MAETISGYAVRFGEIAVIGGAFRERINRQAFDRTLRDRPDVVALIGHDWGRVLGRTKSGTLRLRTDRIGLYFNLDADPTTPSGQEALGTVGRGDVQGCSFGFAVRAEEWLDDGEDLPLRTITDVDLYEVSLTALPAYDTTSAVLGRSQDNAAAARRRVAEAAMRRRGIRV